MKSVDFADFMWNVHAWGLGLYERPITGNLQAQKVSDLASWLSLTQQHWYHSLLPANPRTNYKLKCIQTDTKSLQLLASSQDLKNKRMKSKSDVMYIYALVFSFLINFRIVDAINWYCHKFDFNFFVSDKRMMLAPTNFSSLSQISHKNRAGWYLHRNIVKTFDCFI